MPPIASQRQIHCRRSIRFQWRTDTRCKANAVAPTCVGLAMRALSLRRRAVAPLRFRLPQYRLAPPISAVFVVFVLFVVPNLGSIVTQRRFAAGEHPPRGTSALVSRS